MRCKVGDLAIIVADDIPDNLGVIVEVLRRTECPRCSSVSWVVMSRRPHGLVGMIGPFRVRTTDLIAHDDALQPIRGEPVVERTAEECPA